MQTTDTKRWKKVAIPYLLWSYHVEQQEAAHIDKAQRRKQQSEREVCNLIASLRTTNVLMREQGQMQRGSGMISPS